MNEPGQTPVQTLGITEYSPMLCVWFDGISSDISAGNSRFVS